ncbi:MAG: MerR family transcriptional regulator [Candidatus Dormiibacterota bacterium]
MQREAIPPTGAVTNQPAATSAAKLRNLDKPLYSIGIAADILSTHMRTLMMYEHLGLVIPNRTATNRRLYSQRNIITLGAIQRLVREKGLNLTGARYVIELLQALDANGIARPAELADVDLENVRL